MDNRKYRMIVRYDSETEQFCAGVPELDLMAQAPSREEAIAMLDQSVAEFLEKNEDAPEPRDAQKIEGKLEVELSATLRRELEFVARQEGMSVSALAHELLAEAVSRRIGIGRAQGARGGGRRDGRPRDGRGGVSRERYHDIMENKASFLEYVRQLESGRSPRK